MAGITIIVAVVLFFLLRKTGNNNRSNTTTNSNKLNFKNGKICSRYESAIISASIFFNVPAKILDAMIFVESSDGINLNHSTGEIGVMGIKRGTESDVKKRYSKLQNANLEYPHDNIAIAAGYLRMCYEVWGNWEQAIVAYHDGIRNPSVKNYQDSFYLDLIAKRINVTC